MQQNETQGSYCAERKADKSVYAQSAATLVLSIKKSIVWITLDTL